MRKRFGSPWTAIKRAVKFKRTQPVDTRSLLERLHDEGKLQFKEGTEVYEMDLLVRSRHDRRADEAIDDRRFVKRTLTETPLLGRPAIEIVGEPCAATAAELLLHGHHLILGPESTEARRSDERPPIWLSIAREVMRSSRAAVLFLNGGSDWLKSAQLKCLANEMARQFNSSLEEQFDVFLRGTPDAVATRLHQMLNPPRGYWSDRCILVLMFLCDHPDGPPRSSKELLARLDSLSNSHGDLDREGLTPEVVHEVSMQLSACMRRSWEDTEVGYVEVGKPLGAPLEGAIGRSWASDLADYIMNRKSLASRSVVLVDGYFDDTAQRTIKARLAIARSHGVGVMLLPGVAPELNIYASAYVEEPPSADGAS